MPDYYCCVSGIYAGWLDFHHEKTVLQRDDDISIITFHRVAKEKRGALIMVLYMHSPESKMIGVNDVASMLSISRTTVWRWAKAGKLPASYNINGNITRWLERDILDYIGIE